MTLEKHVCIRMRTLSSRTHQHKTCSQSYFAAALAKKRADLSTISNTSTCVIDNVYTEKGTRHKARAELDTANFRKVYGHMRNCDREQTSMSCCRDSQKTKLDSANLCIGSWYMWA